jgi:sugar/nucleoside kinase (ribokinase family)
MVSRALEVVHVGAACRDVASDDARGWRLGGGVTYAALATARLGLRTAAVVGVDAVARSARELDTLRDAGVDLLLVDLDEGPIFHNVETPAGRVQTAVAVGRPLPAVPVPDSWRVAAGWSLVPVAGEVGDDWLTVVGPDAVVGLGWQGLLRTLVAGARVTRRGPAPGALVARADLIGVSRDDVEGTTSLTALTGMLRPGARLLVTHGQEGGLLVTVGSGARPPDVWRYLPTATDREVDVTGAGDTFLAALLAATVRPSILGPSRGAGADLRFAAAAGSLAVEAVGLDGVPDRAAVNLRRARERVRRAILPSLASQVGVLDPASIATSDRDPTLG